MLFSFFVPKCARCLLPLQVNDFVQRSRQHTYHSSCFHCIYCGKHLKPGDEYFCINSQIICPNDYHFMLQNGPPPQPPGMIPLPGSMSTGSKPKIVEFKKTLMLQIFPSPLIRCFSRSLTPTTAPTVPARSHPSVPERFWTVRKERHSKLHSKRVRNRRRKFANNWPARPDFPSELCKSGFRINEPRLVLELRREFQKHFWVSDKKDWKKTRETTSLKFGPIRARKWNHRIITRLQIGWYQITLIFEIRRRYVTVL